MTVLQGFLLSLLQGATEFLPVSSEGHLVLARELWSVQQADNIAFDVLVHVGTLVAVCVVFRQRIASLIAFLFGDAWRGGIATRWLSDPRGRMILAVILGTIPTGIMGVALEDYFKRMFSDASTLGYQFCFTALLLAATAWKKVDSESSEAARSDGMTPFPLWMAFVIGVAQGVSIVPAISRSGATIAVAILIGMDRRTAGEFSFLLSIPAILGAMVLEMKDFDTTSISSSVMAVSFVTAAVSGYVFLRFLLRFVRGGQFSWFSIYCFALGVWAIIRFR